MLYTFYLSLAFYIYWYIDIRLFIITRRDKGTFVILIATFF